MTIDLDRLEELAKGSQGVVPIPSADLLALIAELRELRKLRQFKDAFYKAMSVIAKSELRSEVKGTLGLMEEKP